MDVENPLISLLAAAKTKSPYGFRFCFFFGNGGDFNKSAIASLSGTP